MSSDVIIIPILFILLFTVIGFWLYTRFRRSQDLIKARMELQTRVLERFDSPSEFTAFLDTDGGRRFLAGLTDERGWRPARRILSAVQWGLVLAFFGAGFVILRYAIAEEDFIVPGILGLSLGLGFLASATASWVLSKAWGLMGPDTDHDLGQIAAGTEG